MDLDEQKLRGAIMLGIEVGRIHPSASSESFVSILEKLQFLTDGKPNNAALALFGKRGLDDRIEIESPGLFPSQITPEIIRQEHGSYPHNPVMANFLFKTTFLESWGTGAKRIINACKEQGLAEPEWEERTGYVVVRFLRPSKEALENLGETYAEPMRTGSRSDLFLPQRIFINN